MTENMKAFMDALKNSEELKEKFVEISSKEQAEQKDYTDEVIALAKECGITLTDEDFESAKQELSDEDLENVSGGLAGGCMGRTKLIAKMMEERKSKLAKKRASSEQDAGRTGD